MVEDGQLSSANRDLCNVPLDSDGAKDDIQAPVVCGQCPASGSLSSTPRCSLSSAAWQVRSADSDAAWQVTVPTVTRGAVPGS
jgi:hypothetical protein